MESGSDKKIKYDRGNMFNFSVSSARQGAHSDSRVFKFIFSAIISFFILLFMYRNLGLPNLSKLLREIELSWFLLFMILFGCISFLTSWRWHRIATTSSYQKNFLFNMGINLSSKAFNFFLPSKVGEFSKAYFLKKEINVPLAESGALIIIERFFDVASICVLVVLASLFCNEDNNNVLSTLFVIAILGSVFFIPIILLDLKIFKNKLNIFRNFDKHRAGKFVKGLVMLSLDFNIITKLEFFFYSLILWCLNFMQFVALFRSFHATTEILTIFSLVPVAIFAGNLPFTLGGLGTRDAVLIFVFAGMEPYHVLAGIGILSNLRNIIPSIIGFIAWWFMRFYKSDVDLKELVN